ncbi:Glucan endo-1-3-beta-glucosidase 1 [Nymphaea thermarum]|nr:Glucan endo-1-3-beta-glucosidase 1 [Nymphaea thermarum]
MQNKGVVPLDNALFRPISPTKEEVDPNTLFHYTNVLDAMIDSSYVSMENLNFSDVPILITETGCPSKGDPSKSPTPPSTTPTPTTPAHKLIELMSRFNLPLQAYRTEVIL